MATTQNNNFSHTRGQITAVKGWIWLKLKPIRDIIVVLVTCKNEEDPLKNNGARVATISFQL